MTWKDGKLITEAKPTEGSNGKATRVEREVVDGELIMVHIPPPIIKKNVWMSSVLYINRAEASAAQEIENVGNRALMIRVALQIITI